ncbi:MAG: D-alanyl-D-alanine carboxypeptidase [Marivibrio sp.]|uniref:D-alanyl-D-alanine carboxypeptidase n=1 Tax=Marivibrio sp. TaxID=2039719 RepID=UPI0032EDCA23
MRADRRVRPLAACALAALLVGCSLEPPRPGDGAAEGGVALGSAEPQIAADAPALFMVRLSDGVATAARRPDAPSIPASTIKLATAIVARDALAPGHRFVTRLCALSPPDEAGVVAGGLALVGGGDPTADLDDWLTLAARARAAGLRAVDGPYLADPGVVPNLPAIAPAQPADAAYNPPISGLMAAEGAHRLEWRADGRSWFVPDLGGTRSGDRRAAAAAAKDRRQAEGEVWLPVADPALSAARLFRMMAAPLGAALPAPRRGGLAAAGGAACPVELARVESARRDAVVQSVLESSSNPAAELLGLAAARARGESPTSLRAAAAGTAQHLRARLPHVDWSGFLLPNHSGLSAEARITPRQMVALLAYAYARPLGPDPAERPLPALLTPGGWAGALAERYDHPETAVRLWAKTGTMHYGVGLAGYVLGRDEEMYAFAAYVSDFKARAAYDRLAADPPDAAEAAARAWHRAARAALDARLVEAVRRLAGS